MYLPGLQATKFYDQEPTPRQVEAENKNRTNIILYQTKCLELQVGVYRLDSKVQRHNSKHTILFSPRRHEKFPGCGM
jgi:hypothetical protein